MMMQTVFDRTDENGKRLTLTAFVSDGVPTTYRWHADIPVGTESVSEWTGPDFSDQDKALGEFKTVAHNWGFWIR